MTDRPTRVLFYVQHLLGIGHLARASRIASALVERGAAVTMVTGGLPVAGFPPPGVPHVALPAVRASDEGFKGLADAAGVPVDAAFLDARRDRLLALFHDFAPDVVVTEAFPFGRRQMRFELLPLLDAVAAARPRPILCCSVRDILQAQTKPGRDAETVALVRAHFDRVLVHGDPGFARIEDSFPLADQIADRVVYTGLVAPPPVTAADHGFDIVVSAGGGAVGAGLAQAAIGAAALLPADLRWCVITGPNLPEADRTALAAQAAVLGRDVTVEVFRKDFAGLLAASRLSVSQTGYNTVCDVLQAGCRSVLVPYAAGGETEQAARAARLAAAGRATVVTEAELKPATLAARIAAALAAPDPARLDLALDGAARTAMILCDAAQPAHRAGQ